MKEKEKAAGKWLKRISFIAGMLIGIIFLYYGKQILLADRGQRDLVFMFSGLGRLIFLMAAGILAGLFFGILIHELGHLLFGLAVGMHFEFFEILRFQFSRGKTGWSFDKRMMRGKEPLALGRVAMEMDRAVSRQGLRLHYGGGVLMNALSALVATIFAFRWEGLAQSFLFCFAIVNFYLAFSNLLPMHMQKFYTDGDILERLKDESYIDEGGAYAPSFYDNLCMEADLRRGLKPADLPDFSIRADYDLVLVQQAMLSFARDLDRGDVEAIADYMNLIRPGETPILNLDAGDRLAYCLIYDCWISPDPGKIDRDLNDHDRLLSGSETGIGRLAKLLYAGYRYSRKVSPIPSLEELQEEREELKSRVAEDPNRGMAGWTERILDRAWADLVAKSANIPEE